MKRKNLRTLELKKNRISNLNLLNRLIGGIISDTCVDNAQTETNPGNIETMYCGETETCQTHCGGCGTNDNTKSLGTPSLEVACNNNFGTFGNC